MPVMIFKVVVAAVFLLGIPLFFFFMSRRIHRNALKVVEAERKRLGKRLGL